MKDESVFAANALSRFRLVGLMEGVSFVVLLLIAMPLKYWADLPRAVTYVGWAHGVLFMAYYAFLLSATLTYRWRAGRVLLAAAAALVPGGPFWLDNKVKGWGSLE
jgi:integral membrane protein